MRARWTMLIPAALAASFVLAPAAPAAAAVKYTCKDKSASFLFWPKGHGASEKAGFPEFRVPHMEVYGGIHSGTFPKETRAYLDPTGAQVNKACTSGTTNKTGGKIAHSAKRKKATNLQCRFGKKPSLVFFTLPGGVRLDVLRAGKPAVRVKIKSSGSSVTFNKNFCEPKSPP